VVVPFTSVNWKFQQAVKVRILRLSEQGCQIAASHLLISESGKFPEGCYNYPYRSHSSQKVRADVNCST
jgi:hypothetical protein